MNKTFISFGVYKIPPTAKLITESNVWFGIFVEPHAHSILTLQKYFEKNRISKNRYLILQNIVSNDDSVVEYGFTSVDKSCGVNSMMPSKEPFQYTVSMIPITLDQIVGVSKFPVEHIRINCEGAELQILEAYSFNCKPKTFFVETHDILFEKDMASRIETIMIQNGYEISEKSRWDYGFFLTFSRVE